MLDAYLDFNTLMTLIGCFALYTIIHVGVEKILLATLHSQNVRNHLLAFRVRLNDPTVGKQLVLNSCRNPKFIIDALSVNQMITDIVIMNSSIGIEEAKAIALLFEKNRKITSFNLSSCEISDEEFKFITTGLKNNQALLRLEFHHDQIRNESAKAIIEALRDNYTLRSVKIHGVNISDKTIHGDLVELVNKYKVRSLIFNELQRLLPAMARSPVDKNTKEYAKILEEWKKANPGKRESAPFTDLALALVTAYSVMERISMASSNDHINLDDEKKQDVFNYTEHTALKIIYNTRLSIKKTYENEKQAPSFFARRTKMDALPQDKAEQLNERILKN